MGKAVKPRLLLVASTTGYQVRMFAETAARMGYELVLATDRCHVLADPWGDQAVPVRFKQPEEGIGALAEHGPFDGIVAVGDQPAFVAAQIAERYGLRFSSPASVEAARNKFLARQRFAAAGLLVPRFQLVARDADADPAYPCVVKPLTLSASRGVIRANNAEEFARALARVRKISADASFLIEDFIPGREFALEGLVTDGILQTIAIFDKPDPLDGPFFEETIYVTPSRESPETQAAIRDTAQRAITALNLTNGPVHAEMRVNPRGVWMLELAARPIGGMCSRVLPGLEETILQHAIGVDVSGFSIPEGGHAVMMIPTLEGGSFDSVEGVERALAIKGIRDVIITAKKGQELIPLPEGASYLGFIFATAETAENAENSLRIAHDVLKIHVLKRLSVVP